ncbi:hypothetical protein GF377_03900, partial [candidate division GN15 bacterium]|nr:hypothetical protein [candidate division GN15 bacterium]
TFSGYDIRGLTDVLGLPLSRIYSGLLTDVRVRVMNAGDLVAIQDPVLRAFFASGGGSVQRFITPKANADEDTVVMSLPTANLSLGPDTLLMVLESRYQLNGDTLRVVDTLRTPVEVLSAAEFMLEEESFKPDSVYCDRPFDISFDIMANGFTGPIDATNLAVHLVDDEDSVITTLVDHQVEETGFAGGTISYGGITAQIDGSLVDRARWYALKIEYQLISEGSILSLAEVPVDSMYILPLADIAYSVGSFRPTVVASGQEASFVFDLDLTASSVIDVSDSGTSFQVIGEGFSTTTNLSVPGDSLVPGTNTVSTERVFVPTGQVGDTLMVLATITYGARGAGNALQFQTDFDAAKIEVQELPTVQIVEVAVEAPNGNRVNTGQHFHVSCQIRNLSTSDQGPFDLKMRTDGQSTFDSLLTVPGVPGDSSTEVFFTVTAADSSNPSELFAVDIATLGISQEPPIDNFANAAIQRPADLVVRYALLGAEAGFVNVNQNFSVILQLENSGEADVTDAVVEISSNGLDLGQPDPFTQLVSVENPANVSFTAPLFDTNLTIDFVVVDTPIDLNTQTPAMIDFTTFNIDLAVITPDVELIAEVDSDANNVVLPGGEKRLFSLRLINPGLSSVTNARIETIVLFVRDRQGRPLDVRRVIEVGSAGFYNGEERVARATAGADRLNLLFDDLVVAADETKDLEFRARTKAGAGEDFVLTLDAEDITATFASGPLMGTPVLVAGTEGDDLLNEVYTSVSRTLDGSFIVRNNPYDPLSGPAEFQYNLTDASSLTFRILTLSGEVVYSRDLARGDAGTEAGLHSIEWNGRNDEGYLVLNGVYVAVLIAEETGEDARLKVAVLK